jgi:adenosylcobinamide-phosphate synthase
MTFLSLLAALLLEQARPLRQGNPVHLWFGRCAAGLEERLDAGRYRHGVIAWAVAVTPLLAVTAWIYHALYGLSPLTAWLWSVVVLYLTMGFRQFSHYFTEIQLALRAGELAGARDWLGRWSGRSAAGFSPGELARAAIEQGLLASHRHVFGTIAWFVALGPAGAMLYRASAMLSDQWSARHNAGAGDFGNFAARAFHWLDWAPARLTAFTLAVVGNFEDAIYCWREQAAAWTARAQEIILASGGGALGVQLGGPLRQHERQQSGPEPGAGEEADADALDSAVRLIWRSLVLWMSLVLLVTVARALG